MHRNTINIKKVLTKVLKEFLIDINGILIVDEFHFAVVLKIPSGIMMKLF